MLRLHNTPHDKKIDFDMWNWWSVPLSPKHWHPTMCVKTHTSVARGEHLCNSLDLIFLCWWPRKAVFFPDSMLCLARFTTECGLLLLSGDSAFFWGLVTVTVNEENHNDPKTHPEILYIYIIYVYIIAQIRVCLMCSTSKKKTYGNFYKPIEGFHPVYTLAEISGKSLLHTALASIWPLRLCLFDSFLLMTQYLAWLTSDDSRAAEGGRDEGMLG